MTTRNTNFSFSRASLGTFLAAMISVAAAHGNPIGLPGTDYDLGSLVTSSSRATYDPGTNTIITTGTKARLILPAMQASPANELRRVELELTAPSPQTVNATWWNLSPRILLNSDTISVDGGSTERIVLDLSTMDATDGTVKVKIQGQPGTVISRVRLIENPKPNIIFILVDDLARIELELGFGRSLPAWTSALDTHIQSRGTVFENYFNTTPLCCPSRASYLTGQYSHNHGIHGNNYNTTGGNGGWRRFWELGHEFASIGGWMQSAGYETVLVGKFLNGYPNRPGSFVAETYIPAGWDEWYGEFNNDLGFSYTNFRLNENGTVVSVNDGTYLTDYERVLAVDFINRTAPTGQPFFMYLSPYAPHGPTEPAARHSGTHLEDMDLVPPPSFNEADLSDKPQHIQDGAVVHPTFFGVGSRLKLDMTLALDELLDAVFAALQSHGILDQTYIFFTSDNGLMRGEHGIGGKSAPYEESINIPLIVRGPGVPENATRHDLVGNIDVAATILDLAGATIPGSVDGESIVELMTGATPESDWRDALQIELLTEISSANQSHVVPPYFGVRTKWHCNVEYETGDTELYDLVRDPFQIESEHITDPSNLLSPLLDPLATLSTCSGSSCRDASRQGWPNAAATFSCTYLDCSFNGSDSVDADGTITDYDWDFGDGATDSGASTTHTFASAGDYTVILTVYDNDGNPGLEVLPVSVVEPTSHVTQVKMILAMSNPLNLRTIAKIFVIDDVGNDIEAATVSGNWTVNGDPPIAGSALTNNKGRAKVILFNPSAGDQLEFCVTGITHPNFSYDPAANLQTCNQAVWP